MLYNIELITPRIIIRCVITSASTSTLLTTSTVTRSLVAPVAPSPTPTGLAIGALLVSTMSTLILIMVTTTTTTSTPTLILPTWIWLKAKLINLQAWKHLFFHHGLILIWYFYINMLNFAFWTISIIWIIKSLSNVHGPKWGTCG